METWRRALVLFAAFVAVACRPLGAVDEEMGVSLRFEAPGEACVAQGFVGWGVEVTSLATGETTTAFVEPFAWAIEGSEVGLDGDAYLFGDYWHGLTAPGDYHVKAYGVLDAALTPAPFMEPDEAVVTVVAGATTEIALVVRCDVMPGGLDVIVLVEEAPVLLDFDLDQKWVAVCQATTFTATVSDSSGREVTVAWALTDATGDVVLSATETFPAGTAMPVTSTFQAWLPTPGDYEGTLSITSGEGEPSVFGFPWHVRVPAISVGACDDGGDPLLLIGCDTSDGYDALALVDDPACLAEAFGEADCAQGSTLPTEPTDRVGDFDGAFLTAWLLRGDVPTGTQWQVGVQWSDEATPVTLPLGACALPEGHETPWEVTVTPAGGTATVQVDVAGCAIAAQTEIPWDPTAPLDTFVLQAQAGAGTSTAQVTATIDGVTDGSGTCPVDPGTVTATWSPPATPPPGTGECADLGYPYGFKIDATPREGAYAITAADGDLLGDTPPDPGAWIDIGDMRQEVDRVYGFDWTASFPIGAVVVKAQAVATYVYDPPATRGDDLETIGRKDISHVTFCWGEGASSDAEPQVTSLSGAAPIGAAATLGGTLAWGGDGLPGEATSVRLHLGHTGASGPAQALPTCADLYAEACGS